MWLCFRKKKNVKWHDKLEESVEVINENIEEAIDNIIDDVTEKVEEKVEETVDDILDKVKEEVEENIDDMFDKVEEKIDNQMNNKSVFGMTNTIKQVAVKRQDSISDLTIETDFQYDDSLNDEEKSKVRPDTPIFNYSPIPKNSLRKKNFN
tara:strand:- start:1673 stop:2125 length:453 start_codon:yes stop_codon:yes gene_type:complete